MMVFSYIKHNMTIIKTYPELFLNSWTLFSRNYITYNELKASLDIINPTAITIDIPDKGT